MVPTAVAVAVVKMVGMVETTLKTNKMGIKMVVIINAVATTVVEVTVAAEMVEEMVAVVISKTGVKIGTTAKIGIMVRIGIMAKIGKVSNSRKMF